MVIVYHAGHITGLSSDTKPTNVPENSLFVETNTQLWYIFISSSWIQFTIGDPSTWSQFVATQDVNVNNNDVINANIVFANVFETRAAATADSGDVRLNTSGSITWRNQANDGNISLTKAGDILLYGGDIGTAIGSLVMSITGDTKITEVNNNEMEFKVEDILGLRIINSITDLTSVVLGVSTQLGTTVTDGFVYIPNMAGTPTGTPTAFTGKTPMVFDDTNNLLYLYDGTAWAATGNVSGPATVTSDGNVARFDGTTGKIIQDSGINFSDSDAITGVASINVDAGGKISLDGSAGTSFIEETSNDIVDIFAGGKRGVRFSEGTDGVDAVLAGSGAIMSQLDNEGFLFMPSWGNSGTPAGTPTNDPTGYGATGISFNVGSFQFYGFNGTSWKTIASTIGKQNVNMDMNDVFPSVSGGASAVNIKTPVTNMSFKTVDFAHSVDQSIEFNVMLPTTRDQTVNPDITLFWFYQNAESGDDVVWGAEIAAFNSFDNMVGKTYGTRTEFEGTSVQELVVNSATIVNIDDNGLGSAGLMHVRITRIGTDGNDTLDQDAILFGIRITYTTATGVATT